jgi:hypothetical protein
MLQRWHATREVELTCMYVVAVPQVLSCITNVTTHTLCNLQTRSDYHLLTCAYNLVSTGISLFRYHIALAVLGRTILTRGRSKTKLILVHMICIRGREIREFFMLRPKLERY